MRYAKGTVSVSELRDIPLLLHVRNSKFISHSQLFELMKLASTEYSRESFAWRVQRLVASNYLSRCLGDFGNGMIVYRITHRGLVQLESHCHYATVLNSLTQHLPHPSHAWHALELNSVRLALARANVLLSWKSDIETASANTISTNPLEKDYDAIVNVWNEDCAAAFGLEYERSIKSSQRYDRIRRVLEEESKLNCILYLGAGEEITWHLARQLSGISKRLAFASSRAFQESLLDTMVILDPGQPRVPFRSQLHGVF
ncbi:MAG TPA: hypothetical protein VFK06_14320 [Candidatus Angelobacter sp.]|nr:hypothetical protein [Candidatus Angelobacter sp.]